MPDQTAIRFVYSGGNIDFTVPEVVSESLNYLQDLQINEGQQQAPTIFYEGVEYKTLEISFDERDDDTIAKLELIRSVTEELTLYYLFAYDGGVANILVIPVVDNDVEDIFYGEQAATIIHKINFLMSA
jgi:hypothetical protein